ncbi:hypothetical protein BCR44DRAFT_1041158 [Catenaria anguillulae PL171]|uniref:L domain-like protein n=1 Tax=Catenaria anguillulae PL171 TaxID=765915 RepID=A0A1Y2HTR6_9FUNG|nr:hypothetical protein BCR44DRAFT_1041158 [Catenaria anguillulae PL171]
MSSSIDQCGILASILTELRYPGQIWSGNSCCGWATLTTMSRGSTELRSRVHVECSGDGAIEKIILPRKGLTGKIPAAFAQLPRLKGIFLDENQLEGSIPSQLGSLRNLEELFLNSNKLSGAIPPSLGRLSALKKLYLDDNGLTDDLPQELGDLDNLNDLHVHQNRLSGTIPDTLGKMRSLNSLRLQSNQFRGTIPSQISQLKTLGVFLAHDNRLTGPVTSLPVVSNECTILNPLGDTNKFDCLASTVNRQGTCYSNLVLANLSTCTTATSSAAATTAPTTTPGTSNTASAPPTADTSTSATSGLSVPILLAALCGPLALALVFAVFVRRWYRRRRRRNGGAAADDREESKQSPTGPDSGFASQACGDPTAAGFTNKMRYKPESESVVVGAQHVVSIGQVGHKGVVTQQGAAETLDRLYLPAHAPVVQEQGAPGATGRRGGQVNGSKVVENQNDEVLYIA